MHEQADSMGVVGVCGGGRGVRGMMPMHVAAYSTMGGSAMGFVLAGYFAWMISIPPPILMLALMLHVLSQAGRPAALAGQLMAADQHAFLPEVLLPVVQGAMPREGLIIAE